MAKKQINQADKDENGINDLIADLDKMKEEIKLKQEELEQKEPEKFEDIYIDDLSRIQKKIRIVNPFKFPKKPKKDIIDYSFKEDNTWRKYNGYYHNDNECPNYEPLDNPIEKPKKRLFKIKKVNYQNIAKSTL